ncbi:hypothetical protein P175DRAFT_0528837 [Aspergillus ochraceoroseus IBT 24754]|uniref:Uncharacterized protein n=1 Tax=Aspergillus ochraceoroseus IBT 24754 TaxID=1392256 RepID=A0A2T5M9T8_9EURO|nr:uncharacterized protein P175DRAFT_0528837 [Aspergillus ochraceoroseus IBT 24754]PTU25298.1 hypothetical protein P175DRAFT_0528837 [Aspergillus ochraceoroseus IBT 24754]
MSIRRGIILVSFGSSGEGVVRGERHIQLYTGGLSLAFGWGGASFQAVIPGNVWESYNLGISQSFINLFLSDAILVLSNTKYDTDDDTHLDVGRITIHNHDKAKHLLLYPSTEKVTQCKENLLQKRQLPPRHDCIPGQFYPFRKCHLGTRNRLSRWFSFPIPSGRSRSLDETAGNCMLESSQSMRWKNGSWVTPAG